MNDVFVTEAWKEKLGAAEESKVKFLADDAGKWTSAIGMGFDATGLLGNLRSHRYAMIVNNGVIEALEQVGPDALDSSYILANLLSHCVCTPARRNLMMEKSQTVLQTSSSLSSKQLHATSLRPTALSVYPLPIYTESVFFSNEHR